MSEQSTVSVDPIEEAYGSKVDRPGLKCRTVVLSDGRGWDIHVLGPSLTERDEVHKKIQLVLDIFPAADANGNIISKAEKRRAAIIVPKKADQRRLQRHYDLFTDMAERYMKSEDPEEFKKAEEAMEKAERAMNSLRGVEKFIAKVEQEADEDATRADEYGMDLVIMGMEETYPGLAKVSRAAKESLFSQPGIFLDALLAVLGMERYKPKKKQENRPNSNGSPSGKSNGA